MKKKLLSLLLALSMGLTLAACGSGDTQESTPSTDGGSGADAELPVLKVAVMPFLNCLPVQYMIENGLDVANGFQIETVYFANGTAMNEALAADQWEVGTLSAAAVNSLAIYGAYCIADIGHSEGGLYTLVSPDSPIAQVHGSNPSYPDVYGDADSVRGGRYRHPDRHHLPPERQQVAGGPGPHSRRCGAGQHGLPLCLPGPQDRQLLRGRPESPHLLHR